MASIPSCQFLETLYLWQADPDLLEKEERGALQAHLAQDPPCQMCVQRMFLNKQFLDARQKLVSVVTD